MFISVLASKCFDGGSWLPESRRRVGAARGEGQEEEKRAGRLRSGQRIIFRYLPALEFFERPPPTSYQ